MARPSSSFSIIKCLSVQADDKPDKHSRSDVPIIALINGLSGGHKGEQMLRLLHRQNILAFDLMQLTKDELYFASFVQHLNELYDDVIMKELEHIKQVSNDDDDDNWRLHPRILIGGGDGSIAWAVSILDKALLDTSLLMNFWHRSELIRALETGCKTPRLSESEPESEPNAQDSELIEILSERAMISEAFYYNSSDVNTSEAPLPTTTTTTAEHHAHAFEFHTNEPVDRDQNRTVELELPTIEENTAADADDDGDGDDDAQSDDDDIESSASLSAQAETEILQHFMHEDEDEDNLALESDLKLDLDYDRPQVATTISTAAASHEHGGDHEASISESCVTHEELQSLRVSKHHIAKQTSRTSLQQLRVLQGIYDLRIAPVIALVPLGTGNDLSRCLGTGFTYPGHDELITSVLHEYQRAPITKLDRWRIQFTGNDATNKERQASEMLCYFSIGFEGEIAYKFAQTRSKHPAVFNRPWKNKLQYVLSGIGTTVEEALNITKPLNDVCEVFADGVKVKLPSKTRSLVVCNINSMADGVFFWGNGNGTKKDVSDTQEPELGDGRVELMAAKGIYKYLQTKMGISHYRRLAQPKKITIITKTDLPIQLDGESWVETPGIIHIYLFHQVFAVVGKQEPRGVRIV